MMKSTQAAFPRKEINALRQALTAGNESAITDACIELTDYIQATARAYSRRECDWASLEQTALMAIVRAIHSFNPNRGKPLEHLVRVAVKNALLDEKMRNDKHFRRFEYTGIDPTEIYKSANLAEDLAPSPADLAILQEHLDSISGPTRRWISTRSIRQQEVIQVHYFDGLTKAGTARHLRISKAAISKLDAALRAAGRNDLTTIWPNQFLN